MVAVLSKALVSASFVLLRYHGASFSHLATVIEGYSPSRIPILVVGGGWAGSVLIILILIVSVVTKQMAAVSMGIDFVAIKNTKVSYTKNYTDCQAFAGASTALTMRTTIVAQTFNAILNPNNSYTDEYYDSSIPLGLVGFSKFERVLPYTEVSCMQFNSSEPFYSAGVPPVNSSGHTWQAIITLPFTNRASDNWINCTVKAGFANAISTCNDTKCETTRISENITSFAEGGNGLPSFLRALFQNYAPLQTSKNNNLIVTWLLGGDILRKLYTRFDDLPNSTEESIASRLALLGTIMTRVVCDANSFSNIDDSETKLPDSPATSTYIERSYYQYKLLWRWPFYVLAGCIFALWLACMIAMWIAPESRVLATDWLLSQYIAKQ